MPIINKTVDVEIEVDMEDFDDDELIEEMESRGLMASGVPAVSSGHHHPVHEIYYALKFGLDDKALELTRAYVSEALGVVL